MHWATDVLGGAVMGTACGVLPALIMHRRDTAANAISLAPSVSSDHAILSVAGPL